MFDTLVLCRARRRNSAHCTHWAAAAPPDDLPSCPVFRRAHSLLSMLARVPTCCPRRRMRFNCGRPLSFF
eukprot:3717569-Pleurochrysis_carterae.AAC.1